VPRHTAKKESEFKRFLSDSSKECKAVIVGRTALEEKAASVQGERLRNKVNRAL
jgi:hypothetical protein